MVWMVETFSMSCVMCFVKSGIVFSGYSLLLSYEICNPSPSLFSFDVFVVCRASVM